MTAHFTLAVRDLSVSTEDEIHVQIEFIPEFDRFRGALSFERAVLPGSGPAAPLTFVDAGIPAIPVELIGAAFTYVTLKIEPIEYPGIYRPVLAEDGKEKRVTGPSFAVQSID